MNPSAECRITAALLRSFRPVVFAGHAAAIVAGLRAGPGLPGWLCLLSLLCWGLVVYLAVRVDFDGRLFAAFAEDPERAPAQLDQFLSRTSGRSIPERCTGALRLARMLVLAWLAQVAALIAALTQIPNR